MSSFSLPAEDIDEYTSAAYFGLVDAAERYHPEPGADFRSYAFMRVRGAVLDCMRDKSLISPAAYRCSKAMEMSNDLREVELKTSQSKKARLRLARVFESTAKAALALRMSYEDAELELLDSDSQTTIEDQYIQREEGKRLKRFVAKLPVRERRILEAIYFKDKTYDDILKEHPDISKSWLSRIHSRALSKLKEKYVRSMA